MSLDRCPIDKQIDRLGVEAHMLEVTSTLARYSYKAGEVLMNKTLTYRSSYIIMTKEFRAKKKAVSMEERRRGAKQMYENCICQYKATLLQSEREYDLMINVRWTVCRCCLNKKWSKQTF